MHLKFVKDVSSRYASLVKQSKEDDSDVKDLDMGSNLSFSEFDENVEDSNLIEKIVGDTIVEAAAKKNALAIAQQKVDRELKYLSAKSEYIKETKLEV